MLIVVLYCATVVLTMEQDGSMSLDKRSQNKFRASLETDVWRRKRESSGCSSTGYSCSDNGCRRDSGDTKWCQSFWSQYGRHICLCTSEGTNYYEHY